MARKLGRLLFSFRGRITRATFWAATLSVASVFVVLLTFLDTTLGRRSSLVLYPFLLWSLASLAPRPGRVRKSPGGRIRRPPLATSSIRTGRHKKKSRRKSGGAARGANAVRACRVGRAGYSARVEVKTR